MQERNPDLNMDAVDLVFDRSEPGVAVLTINRPGARNALRLALIRELTAAFDALAADAPVKAIVLAANGSVFCSGHDLKEMNSHRSDADGGRAFFEETMTSCARLMQTIVKCPKPVIAAVQGIATAAGCQLVASCDLAIAADEAVFATPGVNIGLFCSTPMVALSRNISRKHAMGMLLLGEPISAETAAAYGLINRSVPGYKVMPEALAMARTIAAKPQATIAIGKAAFYAQVEMPLENAYVYASKIMVENMMRADATEGICAFLEKRAAVWPED